MNDERSIAASSFPAIVPAEDLNRALVERSGLRLACLNLHSRVIGSNAGFCALFGVDAARLRGQVLFNLLQPGTDAQARMEFTRLRSGDCDRITLDVIGVRDGGAAFGGTLTGVTVKNSAGQVAALLAVIDIGRAAVALPDSPEAELADIDAAILEGIAAGESNVQLARKLHLSRQGIDYRVAALLRRLGTPNRAALVARAYVLGLLSASHWPPRAMLNVPRWRTRPSQPAR